MNLKCKSFEQLNTAELYAILQARSAVFVVEQTCPYQDVDGLDQESLHLWLEEDSRILAYLREFWKDQDTKCAKIGRVLTTERGCGLGAQILREGIRAAWEQLQADSIFIEAQTYAMGFYEKAGFRLCGEEFLEDDIPHVPMRLRK
ncbi:MAG: GNAT family N-acetyltransferase [Oscillospiraceae bacterium]|nr:GNAT family N-acetyltransferase [Oscillospiraceae bacterium]